MDVGSEPEQSVEARCNKISTLPSSPQQSLSGNCDGLDLFNSPFAPENVTSTDSAVNTSHFPGLSSTQTIDLFQPSLMPTASNIGMHQPPKPILSSSLDLFSEMPQQQPAATFNDKSPKAVPQNEGWATFDMPQHSAPAGIVNSAALEIPSDDNSLGKFKPLMSLVQWPFFEDHSNGPSSSIPTQQNAGLQKVETMSNTASVEVSDSNLARCRAIRYSLGLFSFDLII